MERADAAALGVAEDFSKPNTTSFLRNAADLRALGFLTLQTVLLGVVLSEANRSFLLAYALGWLAVIAANAKHNHMHRRTFRSAWANIILDHWLGLLTGTTATSIITEHNLRHHGHSNSEDDFVRASLVGFRWQWLNVVCFFPRAAYELYIRKPLDFRLWWRQNRILFWRGLAEQVTLWGFFVSVAVYDWKVAVIFLLLPWVHGQWWLVTFNLLQHQALAPEDPWQNSRNIVSPLFNFFFLNVGFHTAHHLRPTLHWSQLPEYHRRVIEPRIDSRLVSQNLWLFYRDWFSRRSVPNTAREPLS